MSKRVAYSTVLRLFLFRLAKKPLAFEFKPGQFSGGGQRYFAGEAETFAKCVGDDRLQAFLQSFRGWFDGDAEFMHRSYCFDVNAEFRDRIDLSQHGFDAGRKHVVAANRHHVIRPSQNSASQPQQLSPRGIFIRAGFHEVSCAIANQRRTKPSEIRDQQFSDVTRCDRFQCFRIDDFGNGF